MAAWRLVKSHAPVLLAVCVCAQMVYIVVKWPVIYVVWLDLFKLVLSGKYVTPLLLVPPLVVFAITFNIKLASLKWRWLEWSPLGAKDNVALKPTTWPWVWLPYTLLLGFCMPFFALVEEFIFRAQASGWVKGLLWGALAFGLVHLISLVSIRMVIYLSLVGGLLVEQYAYGGLAAAFVLHAVYNLTILALVVANLHLKGPGLRLAARSQWLCSRLPVITRWGDSPLQHN